jgi:ribosomal-protein-alanine N-acetyltransferase
MRGVIRLVRADVDLLDAAIAGDRALAGALGLEVVPGWATFRNALPRTRDAVAGEPIESPWGPRLFATGEPPELVGWGGFKGPPRDGVVELGYEIAESRRGQGLATAAVRAMVTEAFGDECVGEVIAHTLPERNASNRVLEKAGFRFDREAREAGAIVWRFKLTRPTRVGWSRASA